MLDIIAVTLIFSIPLSAILGSIYIKSKKLNLQKAESKRLLELLEENKQIKSRLESLETIIAGANLEMLTSGSLEDSEQVRAQIQAMKKQSRFRLED